MSLYVYAIADAPVALDDLRGVAGEPLLVVTSGDGKSHAIAGDLAGAITVTNPPVISAETLRAQDALVRELAARAGALLPARFGARFADEQALRQTLDDLALRLERALRRVRGREQMTIRLFHEGPSAAASVDAPQTPHSQGDASEPSNLNEPNDSSASSDPSDDAPLGPGTRYMRRRAEEGRRLPAAVENLRAALADFIDDERVERGQPPSGPSSQSPGGQSPGGQSPSGQSTGAQSPVIGSIHHLIPRGTADRYRARLDEAAASPRFAASGIRLRVSGPSPAYAFAEADLS